VGLTYGFLVDLIPNLVAGLAVSASENGRVGRGSDMVMRWGPGYGLPSESISSVGASSSGSGSGYGSGSGSGSDSDSASASASDLCSGPGSDGADSCVGATDGIPVSELGSVMDVE
jgi:hypothetical protein